MGKQSAEITHALKKRSWWDGSITGMCGQKLAPGHYRENWTDLAPVTCPGCLAAFKKGR